MQSNTNDSPLGAVTASLPQGAKAPALMTVREYAYRVAIKRESIVGFVINLIIMSAIFWGREDIPVLGWLSIMAVVAPTAYCALAFPTFFGIADGVTRRQKGKLLPPLDRKYPWIIWALWRAFLHGAPCCTVATCAVLALDHYHPTFTLPGWVFIVFVPPIATAISVVFFVRALLTTEKF